MFSGSGFYWGGSFELQKEARFYGKIVCFKNGEELR
jgi:hypothetical protein